MSNVVSLHSLTVDNETTRFLERHPLFKGLRSSTLQTLASSARVRSVSRRGQVWAQNEPARMIHIVRSGVVRIARSATNDRELALQLRGRRSIIGLEALYSGLSRHTDATAHEDAQLIGIPRDAVMNAVATDPALGIALFEDLVRYQQRVDRRTASIAYLTARARVAGLLLELAHDFGVQDSRGTIVNVRLTHREMASLVGATRETVSFAILAFRKDGLIETEHKRVVLLDRPALERAANEQDG